MECFKVQIVNDLVTQTWIIFTQIDWWFEQVFLLIIYANVNIGFASEHKCSTYLSSMNMYYHFI